MIDEYDQVYDGEWWDLPKTTKLQCCSRGLVHDVKLRMRKGKLQICVNRDRKETRRARALKKRG